MGGVILAQWIRLSGILALDINYYLTHVILPRVPPYGCSFVVLEPLHIIVK